MRTFTKYPSNYVGAASETSGAAMRRRKREAAAAAEQAIADGADLLATDGDWELWTPKTFEASIALGRRGGVQAVWDTCWSGDFRGRYFDHYTKKGPLYIFINKSTGEKYQYHPASREDWFFDSRDRFADFDSFICEHPAFADYFGVECE